MYKHSRAKSIVLIKSLNNSTPNTHAACRERLAKGDTQENLMYGFKKKEVVSSIWQQTSDFSAPALQRVVLVSVAQVRASLPATRPRGDAHR